MKRLLTTMEVARTVGINRVTLQKWIRVGRVKAPTLAIRNGRAVRLWSAAEIREVKKLKDRRDALNDFMKQIKAQVATSRQRRKVLRQGRLDFRK